MPARTPLRFVAPLLLAGALLAGCGESGGNDADRTTTTTESSTSTTRVEPSGDPGTTVLAAVERSIDQPTMTFDLAAEVEGMGQQQAISYRGKIDHEAEIGEASFEADGRGALTGRVFGTDTYLMTDSDGWAEALDGKTWLKVDPGELSGVGTLADLDTGGNVLYRLLNATDVEEEKGTDDVDGVEVRTYTFTLDPELSGDVPKDRREGVEALIQATGSGVLTIDGTVGIGTEDGFVHVVDLDGGVRAPGDDEGDDPRFTISYHGSFTGFGEEIDVEKPPAADTATSDDAPDALDLIRQIQSG